MTGYFWVEVANYLVKDHAGEIASAIMRAQADRAAGTWFAKHNEAAQILHECAEHDPTAVWAAMLPYLSSRLDAFMFSIGFPRGILELIPAETVMGWVDEKPDDRAAMVAKLAKKNIATDETLAARVLGAYGDKEEVAGAFFAEHVSGSWFGSASSHWEQLAEKMDGVAKSTKLPKVRRWAMDAAQQLRGMAERDRAREEEEDLRRQG